MSGYLDALIEGIRQIQDEGTNLPSRSSINFTGSGVTTTDDPANSRINVAIGGISPGVGTWVDVTAPPFNAVGNGITDDTSAIMTAAESLRVSANSTPGTLYFPAGDYRVTGLNFSTHNGLKCVGDGALASNATAGHLGRTIIRALGTQAYVLRNASVQTSYHGITFHGNDQTTGFVFGLEYFTNSVKISDCAIVHTKYDNTIYTNGAYLIAIGVDANLEIDDSIFDNCVIVQDPDNSSNYCRACIFNGASNAYLINFFKCLIAGGHDNIYISAGGVKCIDCDFENAVRAHIIRDYSQVSAGLAQQSPTWVSRCFTETNIPFVQDINASAPNPALNQCFGELYLSENFTSTYAGLDICLLADTHISGGKYGNINIQASSAFGGFGYSYVSAHHVSFQGGAGFTGAGQSNLVEVGTTFDNFPSLTKTQRSAVLGQLTLSSALITGTSIRWQENATPSLSQDPVSSNRAAVGMQFSVQSPYSGATGVNRDAPDFVINIPSPTSTGNVGHFRVNTGPLSNAQELSSTSATFRVPIITAVSGDVSASILTSTTVDKIKNTAITTAGGALTSGQALRVTGTSTADWGAINLANSSAVTGTLPTGNQAAQSMGGDIAGTTAAATVNKLSGTSGVTQIPDAGAVPTSNVSSTGQIYEYNGSLRHRDRSGNITGLSYGSAVNTIEANSPARNVDRYVTSVNTSSTSTTDILDIVSTAVPDFTTCFVETTIIARDTSTGDTFSAKYVASFKIAASGTVSQSGSTLALFAVIGIGTLNTAAGGITTSSGHIKVTVTSSTANTVHWTAWTHVYYDRT